jgi:FdhE protein
LDAVTATATIRVTSAEEIAARSGGETPFLVAPNADTVFAERAMRLRQLAVGHAMGDFLGFMAELALAQQRISETVDVGALPDETQLDAAARQGMPVLSAPDWPRPPGWRAAARALASELGALVPTAARARLTEMASSSDDWLERQADCLLTGVMEGLELATSPIVAAALQVTWVRLVAAVHARPSVGGQPFGRIDDALACPCCGSRPVASITRFSGEATGQRYLACSLCATQWHLPRGRCAHCGKDKHVAYQSLALASEDTSTGGDNGARAAKAAVQAETCDDCGHYLKLMHSDRDPLVEPVADDLATVALDLLVSEAGPQRHGINLMLLFGAPDAPPAGAP